MAAKRADSKCSVTLTKAELELLRKYDFPGTRGLLATASPVKDGYEVHGSGEALDDLLGWVAGQANHERRERRKRLTAAFDAIADKLDDELG